MPLTRIRETHVQIVADKPSLEDGAVVHTIDVWFSQRRRSWIVERLDGRGDQIGAAYRCDTEDEAAACLAEWLRTHGETHLVSPFAATSAERRILAKQARHRAA